MPRGMAGLFSRKVELPAVELTTCLDPKRKNYGKNKTTERARFNRVNRTP